MWVPELGEIAPPESSKTKPTRQTSYFLGNLGVTAQSAQEMCCFQMGQILGSRFLGRALRGPVESAIIQAAVFRISVPVLTLRWPNQV